MPTTKKKSALGEDPLAWIGDSIAGKQPATKTTATAARTRTSKPKVSKPRVQKKARRSKTKRSSTPRKTTSSKSQNQFVLKLARQVSIADVTSLYQSCQSSLGKFKIFIVDASNVESIDTPVAQLLVVFFKELQARKLEFELRKPSQGFSKVVEMLGLEQPLGLTS